MDKKQMTALIILNYNNFEDTLNCIESVKKYNTAPAKIIVVDNGSTRHGTVDVLDQRLSAAFGNLYCKYDYEECVIPSSLPEICLVVSKTNDGYAQGNNKGLLYAYADSSISDVMILNNDILFVEDIVPQLLSARQELRNVGIISPILYKKGLKEYDYNCARLCHHNWEIILTYLLFYRDLFHIISKLKNKRYLLKKRQEDNNRPVEVDLPSGSCMLIDKELMRQLGSFDPHTFLYFEENILHKKIEAKSLKNYVLPNIKCIHLGASSTKESKSFFTYNAGLNSASFYLKKYANMTKAQSFVWFVAYHLFKIKIFLVKYLK